MRSTDAVTPQPLPARLRAYLSTPDLAALWDAVRDRLERNGLRISGALTLDLSDAAADRLSGLLGRVLAPGPGRRIKLADLDTALRRSAAERGLIGVLEDLHHRPLTDHTAARRDAQAQWAHVWRQLDAAVADEGLADAAWVPDWIAGMHRSGILTRAGADAAARAVSHAVAALGLLAGSTAPYVMDPANQADQHLPATTWDLAVLASRATGNAHGLDDSRLAAAVLLRAAALARGVPQPDSASARRDLWHALGVATDAVSGTVLVWRLRPPGADRWSAMLRERADLGLITHLTLHELDQAGTVEFAQPGQAVWACENPQVLQAAARAGVELPLICLSGNPASVGTRLLRGLIAAGNPVKYHGDFDWPGVAIAGRIVGVGALPWRMSAADYRHVVANLDADHAVALTGRPTATPWDSELAVVMSKHGLAVHEEFVMADLLTDLDQAVR